MEEDSQEISGWNDDNFQILDDRCLKFNKKRSSPIAPSDDAKLSRRLRQSNTLPIIKNVRNSLVKQNVDNKEKGETNLVADTIIQAGEKKIIYQQKIEETKKQKSHHLLHHNKREHHHHHHHQTLNMDIQHYLAAEDNEIFHKHQTKPKHSNTTATNHEEELSNICRLKIQASEYNNSSNYNSKHMSSFQDKQRSKQILMRLNKNYSRDFIGKKQKSKHFVVMKKDKVSPEKVQQQILKIAIQSQRRSLFEEAVVMQSPQNNQQQKPNSIFKQRHKNLAKTIDVGGKRNQQYKNLDPKYKESIKLSTQKKKKVRTELNSPARQSEDRVGNNITDDFIKERSCWLPSSSRTYQHLKIRNQKKLIEQSQNVFQNIRLTNQRSLKTLIQTNQAQHQKLMDEVTQHLTFVFAKKQKNHVVFDNLVKLDVPIKNLKEKHKINKISSRKHRLKISSQPTVLDEFNDECIFLNK